MHPLIALWRLQPHKLSWLLLRITNTIGFGSGYQTKQDWFPGGTGRLPRVPGKLCFPESPAFLKAHWFVFIFEVLVSVPRQKFLGEINSLNSCQWVTHPWAYALHLVWRTAFGNWKGREFKEEGKWSAWRTWKRTHFTCFSVVLGHSPAWVS